MSLIIYLPGARVLRSSASAALKPITHRFQEFAPSILSRDWTAAGNLSLVSEVEFLPSDQTYLGGQLACGDRKSEE